MEKAGTIIRVSTAKQLEGTSPEKQLERIQVLASHQDYVIEDQHVWKVAESGSLRERVGFTLAIQAAEAGEIQRVYVFNVDRLGRDLLEMLLFLRNIDDLGIECWGAENGQQLQGDDFMLQIEGAVAAKERREIIKRTQDGMIRAIKAGKYSGGIVAYGYKVNHETKKLEIEEKEAEVIRMMFKWCVEERLSCVKIAERMNALSIPTRYKIDGRKIRGKGKRSSQYTAGIWRAGRLLNMLRNPAYIGKWEWGKRSNNRKAEDRIAGYCPAIISEEIFQQTDRVLVGNQLFPPKKYSKRNYLLRGLIKCEMCGLTFSGNYSYVGPGKMEKRYYTCNGRRQWKKLGREKCYNQSLNASEIESVVWDEIKIFCQNPEIAIEQLRAERIPWDESIDENISEIDDQLKELKRQAENILKISIESKEVSSEALDQHLITNQNSVNELVEYRARLTADKHRAITFEDSLGSIAIRLSTLHKRIEGASFEEKRRAVKELVKGISVVSESAKGKHKPVVTMTFRFNDPVQNPPDPIPAVLPHRTAGRAGTTANYLFFRVAFPVWFSVQFECR